MRRLLAILLLAPHACLAQNYYANIVCVSTDTASQNKVIITWSVTPVSDDQSYTIYRWDGTKFNDIAVVNESSTENRSYTDVKAHSFEHAERYAIYTDIPGQVSSDISDGHQTVFLRSGDYDKCECKLNLIWSAYVGAAVKEYSVYGRIEGQSFELLGKSSDTTFYVGNLHAGTNYNFFVVAELHNGLRSFSNLISYSTFEPIPPRAELVFIDSIFNHQGQVEIVCNIDTAADVLGYAVKAVRNSNVVSDTICGELNLPIIRLDSECSDCSFELSAVDFCGSDQVTAEPVCPIVLDAVASGRQIELKWNRSLGDGEKFTVYCSIDGASEKEIATSINEMQYSIDCINEADEIAQNFCIRVESLLNAHFSSSNILCVELQPDVAIPNAFTPNGDGLNDTFGPSIRSAQISDFEFVVFDRYGGSVFSTDDPAERWDGTCAGSHVAEGGYIYYLRIKLHGGQTIEKKGAVNLIYP